jgi:uncharacterized protein YaiI (UPF0178 family)
VREKRVGEKAKGAVFEMKIIVDADACPKNALQICMKLGKQYAVPVWTVASMNHHIVSDHHVIVDIGSQAADIKVINLTDAGDIIITQDWGLAAMVLGKPAFCLSPVGREYRADNIEFLMEEREVKAKVRRGGGRTKGPRKRTGEDDLQFEKTLLQILEQATVSIEQQSL